MQRRCILHLFESSLYDLSIHFDQNLKVQSKLLVKSEQLLFLISLGERE